MGLLDQPTIDAVSIGCVTLVGYNYSEPPPYQRGNCFDLVTEKNEYFKIVNFNHENLEYALEHKLIDFPIPMLVLSPRVAAIHDLRIPNNWYDEQFCGICTPERFLSITQQLQLKRDRETGRRQEFEAKDGLRIIKTNYGGEPKWQIDKVAWNKEIEIRDKAMQDYYDSHTVDYPEGPIIMMSMSPEECKKLNEEIKNGSKK